MDGEALITVVDPSSVDAQEALTRYLTEISERVEGLACVDPALVDEVDDYRAPGGRFLIVRRGTAVIGCGAVRTLAPEIGEVKRMWISPDSRGAGLGSRLLESLVAESRALGHRELRLDTNEALTEALALYAKHGFEPVPRYNDNPDATHFLGRRL